MDRKTKTITLPSGKSAELKEYITARERNKLRGIILSQFSFKPDDEIKPEINISGDIAEKMEHKRIGIGVVSYDGSAENILERILDGTPQDYDFIIAELNKLDTGGFQKAK